MKRVREKTNQQPRRRADEVCCSHKVLDSSFIPLSTPQGAGYETLATNQFPYKTITAWKQCLEAFEFIVSEIKEIENAIDDGVDLIFYFLIFRKAVNFANYQKKSDQIQQRADKISAVTTLIRNFLANGTVPNHEGRELDIAAFVDTVNITTDFAETLVNAYNKGKKTDMPSIEAWYNSYVQSINLINSVVDAWNITFQTNEEKARLPEIPFKFGEAFQLPPECGDASITKAIEWRGIVSEINNFLRRDDKDPFTHKNRYRETSLNDDSIVNLYRSMPDNQLGSWDEVLEKGSMEFSEVFRLFKLLLKPLLRESMGYLETLPDQGGYRGLVEERLEDINNTIKYLSTITKITSVKTVNIRINGINAQFLATKDLLAIAGSKLEAEADKNKKEQGILNESREIFFEIAAKAKWINGLISKMKGVKLSKIDNENLRL